MMTDEQVDEAIRAAWNTSPRLNVIVHENERAIYRAGWQAARADLAPLRAALDELVACKDLKDRIADMNGQRPWPFEVLAIEEDYVRRKPLAWAAARALIKEPK